MNVNTLSRRSLVIESKRIGDVVLGKSIKDSAGVYWKSLDRTNPGINPNWIRVNELYNGSAGICLFLVELYRFTKDKRYLIASENGIASILDSYVNGKDVSESYSLLSGKMGVAFVLLRLFEVTKTSYYLEQALQISRQVPDHPWTPVYEYLGGISGTILGLLHVHSATNDDQVLHIISKNVEMLLNGMNTGKKGVFWDRGNFNQRGLCGFSHGVSGIASVLLEIGHYFDNPAFYEIAKQAFIYEDQYFDAEMLNWQDLRSEESELTNGSRFEEAYKNGDQEFFYKSGNQMNAWCHGAVGIGLARCWAFERLPSKRQYRRSIQTALRKTFITDISNATATTSGCLCHGSSGNSELFLEAYRIFGSDKYLRYANISAAKHLAHSSNNNLESQDEIELNLFLGLSGFGYFLVRLLDPHTTPSILTPKIFNTCKVTKNRRPNLLNLGRNKVHRYFIEINYSRTINLVDLHFQRDLDHFIKNDKRKSDFKLSFHDFVTNLTANADKKYASLIHDIYSLESKIASIDEEIKSYNWLSYKRKMIIQDAMRLSEMPDSSIYSQLLVLNSDIFFFKTKWNWHDVGLRGIPGNPMRNRVEDVNYLLLRLYDKVYEKKISRFSLIILEAFKEKKTVENALKNLVFEAKIKNRNYANKMILGQLREMIKAGFLLDPDKHPADNGV